MTRKNRPAGRFLSFSAVTGHGSGRCGKDQIVHIPFFSAALAGQGLLLHSGASSRHIFFLLSYAGQKEKMPESRSFLSGQQVPVDRPLHHALLL